MARNVPPFDADPRTSSSQREGSLPPRANQWIKPESLVPPNQIQRFGPPMVRISLKEGLSLTLESGYLVATLLLPSEVNTISSDAREHLFLFFKVKMVGPLVPYAVGDVIILPNNVAKQVSSLVGDDVVVHQRDVAGVVKTEQEKENLGETLEREQHAAEDALWDERD